MNMFANGGSIQGSFGTDDDESEVYKLRRRLSQLRRHRDYAWLHTLPTADLDLQIVRLEDEIHGFYEDA